MKGYDNILLKLKEFTRRFYIKQLVKGSLLFLTLGLLFFIAVMTLEYALWMSQGWRQLVFILFLIAEGYLLYRFILVPLFYLFKVKKGLTHKEAAKIIGKHFSDIDDRLLNLLQLSENREKSDLLLASIAQRSEELGDYAFTKAINIKESLGYVKYVAAPAALLGIMWVTGNIVSFFNSYERVANYDLAFERPAPFSFSLLSTDLTVLDNEPLEIKMEVKGEYVPEDVFIVLDGERLLLQRRDGVFTHLLQAPVQETNFYFTANDWDSRIYTIESLSTPAVTDFQMRFSYPKYLRRASEKVTGTGNAVVPEGTRVTWEVLGDHIQEVGMVNGDSTLLFSGSNESFVLSKSVYNDLPYAISTSNENVRDFEKLEYQIDVIKDAYPRIEVEQVLDSLNPNQSFYTGQVSDDYGVSQLRLVCFPSDDRENMQRVVLESPNSTVHQFYYTFPSGLKLDEGVQYKLYFEVVDNDGLRKGKSTRSGVFDASIFGLNELKNKELQFQNTVLENLEKSVDQLKEQKETLDEITDKQKEGNNLNFEDKNQIKEFLRKQEEQDELMKKFSNQLNKSLEKNEGSEEMRKMLQERLERQELEARKNEKLLKELNELSDKIDKEQLKKKLEELGKKQSSSTRNLEQILELTKRYYVTEKMAQLSNKLDKLSEEQEKLSDHTDNKISEKEEQSKVNEEFNKVANEIEKLKKDNEKLNKPFQIDASKEKQDAIKSDQKDALDEMSKDSPENESSQSKKEVSKKQKAAAQKLKEMSESLQQSSIGGGGSSVTEDAEMLRQILDNLVTFSFKQENLFETVETADLEISQFAQTVKSQKELRRLFEHVDDSLFALSLRRAELSEFVNEQITEVYYNIDKSLESIADNQVFRGASHQQYVINATNALADFLANILDNMQQSMQPGQGSGQGGDFQLPDIIEGQKGIQEKMNGEGQGEGKQSGEEGEKGEGDKQGDGRGEKEGDGESGEGRSGKQGQGQDGDEGGQGEGEMKLSELYEIYKEQQFLRQQLEKQLQDMINNEERGLAKKLVRQMEDFENDLLENGVTQRTRNKANLIQHQLLKLKNASLKQGEQKERESNTNKEEFRNPVTTKPEALKNRDNNIEILNRQALPLRQNYGKKVKEYFNND